MKMNEKGFTMLELLVVIAIIGLVAGASVGAIKGYARQARAIKCQANMHALAKAVMAYRADTGYYPVAGAYEIYESGNQDFFSHRGWVNWVHKDNKRSRRNDPANPYKGHDAFQKEGTGLSSTQAGNYRYVGPGREKNDFIGANQNDFPFDKKSLSNIQNSRIYRSIDEGSIFVYADKSFSIYCCDEYRGLVLNGKLAMRSYAMNRVFGSRSNRLWDPLDKAPNMAERLALFIEFDDKSSLENNRAGNGDRSGTSGSANAPNDCYKDDSVWDWDKGENIGAPHRKSGRWFGHVVFADGHLEAVELPLSDVKKRTVDNKKAETQRKGLGQGLGYKY